MFGECKVKYYYSDNTNDLIRKKYEIEETSFRRADKNKKTRALIIKDIQIFISKALDYISMSFKNPITCFFVISTLSFASFTFFNFAREVRFENRFFSSLENDSIMSNEMLLRIQKHYYNTK